MGTLLGTLLHPFATLRGAAGGKSQQQAQGTAFTSYVGSTPCFVPAMGPTFMGSTASPMMAPSGMTMAFGAPSLAMGSSGMCPGFPGSAVGGGMSGIGMGSSSGTTFGSPGGFVGSTGMPMLPTSMGSLPGSSSMGAPMARLWVRRWDMAPKGFPAQPCAHREVRWDLRDR